MEAQGDNGKLTLEKGYVEISRKGFTAFLAHGLKGNKKIAIKQISSIQYRNAGLLNGYIQFSFLGGQESKSGYLAAFNDENTVTFTKKQQPAFDKIKEQVEKQIYS